MSMKMIVFQSQAHFIDLNIDFGTFMFAFILDDVAKSNQECLVVAVTIWLTLQ